MWTHHHQEVIADQLERTCPSGLTNCQFNNGSSRTFQTSCGKTISPSNFRYLLELGLLQFVDCPVMLDYFVRNRNDQWWFLERNHYWYIMFRPCYIKKSMCFYPAFWHICSANCYLSALTAHTLNKTHTHTHTHKATLTTHTFTQTYKKKLHITSTSIANFQQWKL